MNNETQPQTQTNDNYDFGEIGQGNYKMIVNGHEVAYFIIPDELGYTARHVKAPGDFTEIVEEESFENACAAAIAHIKA